MSTSFTLQSDTFEESVIALRFWGGVQHCCIVRFTFPKVLLTHIKDVELIGDNGETITVGELHDSAESIDFLSKDVTPQDHISHGSVARRDRWEDR